MAGSLRATYTYNGLEQLASRVLTNMTPSGTTHFVHDRAGNVIAETDGSGPAGTVREYIWLPGAEIAPTFAAHVPVDRPLAVVDGVNTPTPVTTWVHVDHLHRPVKMTDAAKLQVWDAVWSPFGAPHAITGPAALDARFPGQWFQIESALHYNWHRHYDPTLGRYTQPDPLGFVDGPSVYGYAKARPQQLTDPDGRQVALPIPLPAICAANPLACGAVVAGAGAYMCYKAISGSSGGGGNDDERCKIARQACHEQCIEYAYNHPTPGIGGSDRPGHYRRCMRQCMKAAGCPYS